MDGFFLHSRNTCLWPLNHHIVAKASHQPLAAYLVLIVSTSFTIRERRARQLHSEMRALALRTSTLSFLKLFPVALPRPGPSASIFLRYDKNFFISSFSPIQTATQTPPKLAPKVPRRVSTKLTTHCAPRSDAQSIFSLCTIFRPRTTSRR